MGGSSSRGMRKGSFTAYEAQTGKVLWPFQCGSGHHSGPITLQRRASAVHRRMCRLGRLDGRVSGDGAPWLPTLDGEIPSLSSPCRKGKSERVRKTTLEMSGIEMGGMMGLVSAGYMICTALAGMPGDGHDDRTSETASSTLTICEIPQSMPRMDKSAAGEPVGLDVLAVRQLAKILRRPIEFHWCASAQCAWNCLPAGRVTL